MKLLIVLSLLAIASAAVFKMGLEKKRNPLARQNPLRANRHFGPKRKATGTEELIDKMWSYVANVTIGTPPQQFRVEIDLMEGDFIVIDSSCPHCDSEEIRKFDPSKSSTYVKDGRQITDVSNIEGLLGKDTMTFGGIGDQQITVKGQIFGHATEMGVCFGSGIDGRLGLGFPAVASKGFVPPLFNAINQGALDEPIFTLWLKSAKVHNGNEVNGQITYGGLDTHHCGDLIAYHPLSAAIVWQFKMKSIGAGGYTSSEGWEAKLKTQVEEIVGPKGIIEALVTALGAKIDETSSVYVVDCNAKLEPIVIGIGSYKYPIEYFIEGDEESPDECYLALIGVEYGSYTTVWEIGNPFLFEYCQVYDLGQQRIGFAPALKK